jgi:hypothetical protein
MLIKNGKGFIISFRQNAKQWVNRSFMIVAILALVLTSYGVFAAPTPGGSHPVAVGPVSSDTGFPTWYKDANGTRLELCLDAGDNPLCGFLPGDIPDPYSTLTVPNNFPEEAFWFLGSSIMTTDATGGKALLVLALEAAFSVGPVAAGDQVSFGRVRIWIDNLVSGGEYKVTHPYGVDFFTAEEGGGRRSIRSTEDIGIGVPGDFTGALNSRIGPFLYWDPAVLPPAPVGYIGDPNEDHAVVGSPFNTNYFRIEGPSGSFPGSPNQCANAALGDDPVATDDCIETNLFSLIGKYATNAGVEVSRATYTQTNADGGRIDVFASSEAGQSIQIARGNGFPTTGLGGDGNGNYFARINFTGAVPAQLQIVNSSDTPAASKTIPVVDQVTITRAEFDAEYGILSIDARSSDSYNTPVLTAVGFGTLDAGGQLVATGLSIVPERITVTSSKGGFATVSVEVDGNISYAPVPIVAGITVPNGLAVPPVLPDTTLAFDVQQGELITLDGTSSTGDIDSYSWTQVSGQAITLGGANTATATFTSPTTETSLEFQLTIVRNNPSDSISKNVTIHVVALQPPLANAGPDQLAVMVGQLVTLDGSASQNAGSYAWTQVINPGDPTVVLNGANTAQPTFTMPNYGNPLTFQLTVTNAGGSATDTVQIQRTPDVLSNVRPQFIRSKNDWKITGNALILGIPAGPGNTVKAYLGVFATEADAIAANKYIGQGQVDSAGTWTILAKSVPANLRAVAGNSITLFSSRGGYLVILVIIK